MTFLAFGEIMLRLSPPGREMLMQTPKLDVWLAGAEANVASALARLGHDVARRVDCGFLARLVAEHRIADWEAADLAHELTSGLVRRAYRIDAAG